MSVAKTTAFAIASISLGSFCSAWLSAASASGKRPRWSSDTAWEMRDFEDVLDGVWAISSKT